MNTFNSHNQSQKEDILSFYKMFTIASLNNIKFCFKDNSSIDIIPRKFDCEYTTIGTSYDEFGENNLEFEYEKQGDKKITYPLKGVSPLHYLTFHLEDTQESGDIIEFVAHVMKLDVNEKHFVPYDLTSYGYCDNLREFQKKHGYLENGITPIHYASSLGKYYHVKAFLNLKANINITTAIKHKSPIASGYNIYYPKVMFKCQSLKEEKEDDDDDEEDDDEEETTEIFEREWKNLTHMGGTIESDAFSLYKNFNGLWYACMFGKLKGDVIDMIKTKTNQIVELVEKYKSENTLEEPVYIN